MQQCNAMSLCREDLLRVKFACSQGAIDLVQMELQPERPVLKMIQLQPQSQEGPCQPEDPAALTVDAPTFMPVHRYTWQDRGDFIQLQIASAHHVAGAQSSVNQLLLCRVSRLCSRTWSSSKICLNGVDNAGICVKSDAPASFLFFAAIPPYQPAQNPPACMGVPR